LERRERLGIYGKNWVQHADARKRRRAAKSNNRQVEEFMADLRTTKNKTFTLACLL
jgi:hypothetical protein